MFQSYCPQALCASASGCPSVLVAPGTVLTGVVVVVYHVGGRGWQIVGDAGGGWPSRRHSGEGSKGVDSASLPSNSENSRPGGSANRIVGCAHRTPILPVCRAPTDVFIYYICDWVGKYSRLDRESVCYFENERRASLRVTAAAASVVIVAVAAATVVVVVAVVFLAVISSLTSSQSYTRYGFLVLTRFYRLEPGVDSSRFAFRFFVT